MGSSRLFAKNPVFETVHEESVKVYHLHMYNGNIQQNPLCVESIMCHYGISHLSPVLALFLAKLADLCNDPRIGHTPFRIYDDP